MKILHVISQLTKGGAERVAVELANSFSAAGDEVTILVTHPENPELLQSMVAPSVDMRFVSRTRRGRAATYASAFKWLNDNKDFVAAQDIVHVHLSFGSVVGSAVVLLRALRRQSRPKVVETYHAVGMAMTSAKRRLHMALAASHDALAAMAEDPVIARFRSRHPSLPYALIPNGVTFDREPPTAREQEDYRHSLGIPKGRPVVGTVGRLVPDRSPDRIVKIFAAIAEARNDVWFFIGGEGSQKDRVAELAEKAGFADRLSLPGLVSRPALPFSMLDLYVTLNVGPITGVAAMEAAAAGLPVVALQLDPSYRPGRDEWIYSDPSPDNVAREALRLLDDAGQRRALAEHQRRHVLRHHGVDTMAASYRQLYRSLLQ